MTRPRPRTALVLAVYALVITTAALLHTLR